MKKTHAPIDLETRFQEPENWHWGEVNRGGYTLRYGTNFQRENQSNYKACLACLPGLSEYSEKFFELINELAKHSIACMVIDWHGQGLSSRYLPNPHKRHASDFMQDADDLDAVLVALGWEEASKTGKIKLHMLAHSMGGNIGMRYLLEHPDMFSSAALIAPMMGIYALKDVSRELTKMLVSGFRSIAPRAYALSGGDWSPHIRETQSDVLFSSDPKRSAIHNAWMLQNSDLQVGHITNEWLYQAILSCWEIERKVQQHPPTIPIQIALAGHEYFVDNQAAKKIATLIPQADVLEFPDARHELLMEADKIRSPLIKQILKNMG